MGNLIFKPEEPYSVSVVLDTVRPIENVPLKPILNLSRVQPIVCRWYRYVGNELDARHDRFLRNEDRYKREPEVTDLVLVSRSMNYIPTKRDVGCPLVFHAHFGHYLKSQSTPNSNHECIVKLFPTFEYPKVPLLLINESNLRMKDFESHYRENIAEGIQLYLNIVSMNLNGFIFPQRMKSVDPTEVVDGIHEKFFPNLSEDDAERILNFQYRGISIIHELKNRKCDIICLNNVHDDEIDFFVKQLYDDNFSYVKCSSTANLSYLIPDMCQKTKNNNQHDQLFQTLHSVIFFDRKVFRLDHAFYISPSQFYKKKEEKKEEKYLVNKKIQIVRLEYIGINDDDYEDNDFFDSEEEEEGEEYNQNFRIFTGDDVSKKISSKEEEEDHPKQQQQKQQKKIKKKKKKKTAKSKKRRFIYLANICFYPSESIGLISFQLELTKKQLMSIIISHNDNNSEDNTISFICGCGTRKIYYDRMTKHFGMSTSKDFQFNKEEEEGKEEEEENISRRNRKMWKSYFSYHNHRKRIILSTKKKKKKNHVDTFIMFQKSEILELNKLTLIKGKKKTQQQQKNQSSKKEEALKEDNINMYFSDDDVDYNYDDYDYRINNRNNKYYLERYRRNKYDHHYQLNFFKEELFGELEIEEDDEYTKQEKEMKNGFPNRYFVLDSPSMQNEFVCII